MRESVGCYSGVVNLPRYCSELLFRRLFASLLFAMWRCAAKSNNPSAIRSPNMAILVTRSTSMRKIFSRLRLGSRYRRCRIHPYFFKAPIISPVLVSYYACSWYGYRFPESVISDRVSLFDKRHYFKLQREKNFRAMFVRRAT
jgi:hypothetical protein